MRKLILITAMILQVIIVQIVQADDSVLVYDWGSGQFKYYNVIKDRNSTTVYDWNRGSWSTFYNTPTPRYYHQYRPYRPYQPYRPYKPYQPQRYHYHY